MIYLIAIQEISTANDTKVKIEYSTENSKGVAEIDKNILPNELFEYLVTIGNEFKRLCHVEEHEFINSRLNGFKIKDTKDSRQEIQFILDFKVGAIHFDNIKTVWREMRDMPIESFQYGSPQRQYTAAMNAIISVFNDLQYFVCENLPEWLEMAEQEQQLSIFEAPPVKVNHDAAKKFRATMQNVANEIGGKITVSSGGEEIAEFKSNA